MTHGTGTGAMLCGLINSLLCGSFSGGGVRLNLLLEPLWNEESSWGVVQLAGRRTDGHWPLGAIAA